MNNERTGRTGSLTVLKQTETEVREGRLLKVTAYPWGVEFETVAEEASE